MGLHLIHGIPVIAVNENLPILNSHYNASDVVAEPHCKTFIPDMLAINASHPGAQPYYDSVVAQWAEQGVDFIYLDGVIQDCHQCWVGEVSLIADTLRRLGNGMHLFLSGNQPSTHGCSWEALSELAPYVRVGTDTDDSFGPAWGTTAYNTWLAHLKIAGTTDGSIEAGFSAYTREISAGIRPHHFPDLASLPVGRVHCGGATKQKHCPAGPDYAIPSNESALNRDEVVAYASLVAILRSSWWPGGVLSEMTPFMEWLLTNDAVIRVAMSSHRPRQVRDAISRSFAGPVIAWTSDGGDGEEVGSSSTGNYSGDAEHPLPVIKNVLLMNMLSNTSTVAKVDFPELGLTPAMECEVLDLWSGKRLTSARGQLQQSLRPHAALFAQLSACSHTAS